MTSSNSGEFSGKTVEEAIELGLSKLGLRKNQADIEIINKGSRGLLGFGAEDAVVRITPTAPPKPASKPAPTPAPKPAKPKVEASKTVPAPRPVEPAAPEAAAAHVAEAPEAEEDEAAVSVDILQGMLDRMEVNATVRIAKHRGVLDAGQTPPLVLNIEGDDLGILIGRRGETLTAIQYLARLMVNHRLKRWTNLVVDVEGYKARREEQLQRLAERMAERAIKSGQVVVMEAMPARERRIVHITLRPNPEVMTQSVGEGDARKVTIIPKK